VPPADARVQRRVESGIPVHFLGLRSRWRFFSAVTQLAEFFAQAVSDLVQCFLFHANVVGTLAARRCGVRHVCTGLRVTERQAWRWWMLRWIDRHVTRRVCVSQSVAEAAEVRGRLSAERTVVIPNGIQVADDPNLPSADVTQFGVPSDRHAITFVGRLHWQKGVDWLLRLMPDALASLPRHDLLIVGVGPQQAKLKRLAGSLGIGKRVHFAGWCDNVAAVLRASQLFVLPSRWEGMPNALLEAMASGLPVVAADVEGVTELLGETASEQVVPAHDAEAFKRKLIRWCSEPAIAARLGSENRRIAERSFSLERMIERNAYPLYSSRY
jgi:glycosyltransferase involved in cell wall biosynthesis